MISGDWPLYRYRGYLARAIDADTIEIDIDLGLDTGRTMDLRIAGIDAPEMTGKTGHAGEMARDYLDVLIAGKTLYVQTHKDGRSFSRYVGDVYAEADGELVSVADQMVAAGYARRVE